MAEVIAAGAALIGHNQVQDAEEMRAILGRSGSVEWHLIGRLQRNKVNRALPLFDLIQSADSLRLARAISERAARPVRVLVEVNVGGEETKSGVPPEEAPALVQGMAALPRIRVEGLMAVEPYREDPADARPCFRRMRGLFEDLGALRMPGVDEVPLDGHDELVSGGRRGRVEHGAHRHRNLWPAATVTRLAGEGAPYWQPCEAAMSSSAGLTGSHVSRDLFTARVRASVRKPSA